MTTTPHDPIYLDFNASTPVLPQVVAALLPFLEQRHGNPSSGHIYGRQTSHAVEEARIKVAALLGCQPAEVIFTSGGTESNNMALRGITAGAERPGHLITSTIEHPAIEMPCRHLEAHGWEISRVPADSSGRVDPARVEDAIRDETALISIMHANNETGSIQAVSQIGGLARDRGIPFHSDAAQAVGKIPTLVDDLKVNLLSVAGHKLYAPKGVGALYLRAGTPLRPITFGASHERGLRPGTENVALIVGLGEACAIAQQTMELERVRVQTLRDDLWTRLQAAIPQVALNGHVTERLPNTLNVRFPGVRGSQILARAPGIATSTGSACHETGEAPSAVLLALGLDPAQALGSVRLSLGRSTTGDEIAAAADELVRAFQTISSQG